MFLAIITLLSAILIFSPSTMIINYDEYPISIIETNPVHFTFVHFH